MAVSSVRVARGTRTVQVTQGADIKYEFKGTVLSATKLCPVEFDEYHRRALTTAYLTPQRELAFGVPGWKSSWIGAGEEKVVFLVIDPWQRAFAIEVLARGTYLEGHLAEGHYFADMYVPGLASERWDCRSLFGHTFSGRIKAREFIYGDTLAGPGLRHDPPLKTSLPRRLIGHLAKSWARWMVLPEYHSYRKKYRDAHEANVMIEVLPLGNPEKKSHYIVPVLWLEDDGKLRWRYYRCTPIDVRAR